MDVLRHIGHLNRSAPTKKLPTYETFTMKKHFPLLIDYLYCNGIDIRDTYGNIRKIVLDYCRRNYIIISRIRLETCELNVPGHVSYRFEAEPLVTASSPPLASTPQPPPAITDFFETLPSPSLEIVSRAPDAIEFPLDLLSHGFESFSYSPLSSDIEDS